MLYAPSFCMMYSMDTMLADVQIAVGAFKMAALITCFAAFIISIVLGIILRSRIDNLKYLYGLIAAAHFLAYMLLLTSLSDDGLNEGRLQWSMIIMAAAPALLLASALGKKLEESAAAPAEAPAIENPDENVDGDAEKPDTAEGKPVQAKPPPGFGEGIIKGFWSFVAFLFFYVIYFMLFVSLLSTLHGDQPPL